MFNLGLILVLLQYEPPIPEGILFIFNAKAVVSNSTVHVRALL